MGNIACVCVDANKELIDPGADVNRHHDDTLPLHNVCNNTDINCPELLAQTCTRPNEEQAASHSVVKRNGSEFSVDMVDILIEHGVDINVGDLTDGTPLHLAINSNNIECVKSLLEHGANVNIGNRYEQTPLYMAINSKNVECVKSLLEHGANINVGNRYEQTPLYLAINSNNIECVKRLLEHGANINVCDSINRTPLYWAVYCINTKPFNWADNQKYDYYENYNKVKCVKLLLQNGADANMCDRDNNSPLYLAVESNTVQCVKLLLYYGAYVNVLNRDRETPLLRAVCNKNVECVKLLLKHGAAVNIRYENNETPLHFAVNTNTIELVNLLLHYGADADMLDNNHDTALNLAARRCHLEMIKTLLNYNANVGNRNLDKQTPLMQAAIKVSEVSTENGKACLDLLIQASGQFDIRSENGGLIPHIARDKELCKMLLSYCVHPRSLQDLCRHQIRSSLHHQFLPDVIPSLNLPKMLQRFVLLQIKKDI